MTTPRCLVPGTDTGPHGPSSRGPGPGFGVKLPLLSFPTLHRQPCGCLASAPLSPSGVFPPRTDLALGRKRATECLECAAESCAAGSLSAARPMVSLGGPDPTEACRFPGQCRKLLCAGGFTHQQSEARARQGRAPGEGPSCLFQLWASGASGLAAASLVSVPVSPPSVEPAGGLLAGRSSVCS